VSQDGASAAFDAFRREFLACGSYDLITRDKVDKILAEMQIQNTALIDEKKRAGLGKLLPAGYLVVGQCAKAGQDYMVSVDIINVETGLLVKSEYATGAGADESALIGLARQVVSKLCKP